MKTNLKITAVSFAIALAACHSVSETDKNQVEREPQPPAPQAEVREEMADAVTQMPAQPTTAPQKNLSVKKHKEFLAAPRTQMMKSGMAAGAHRIMPMPPAYEVDRENYHHFEENGLKLVAENPVSTFSIDVDTGSYSNVRRFINQGQIPRQDAVRVEELINYFNYGYQAPDSSDTPFAVYTELAPSPWSKGSVLMHIGLKGYEIPTENLPPANLIFLIDVSGSMSSPNKIGLLKQGFKLLTKQLRAQDTISIAVYAGASGVVLEPTSGDQKHKILAAIEQLQAGGSTNGAAGINLAYQLAQQGFKKDGINRVILATDGDFNVGTVNFEALVDLVEEKRKTGIALTTLGFGTGNYNDHLMEQLADKGNGNYSYIDNLQEARKVLVEEMGSTLNTIAKDVKIQVEFNPNTVASYRLIGYENRALNREDFNNDKVDAGDIGAGHTVTALYELELVGQEGRVDPLRYGSKASETTIEATGFDNELAFLKLRYKQPNSDTSQLLKTPILKSQQKSSLAQASEPFRFSAAVAAFGQILKGGKNTGNFNYDDVVSLGLGAKGRDQWGYRSEFINLVRLAKNIAE